MFNQLSKIANSAIGAVDNNLRKVTDTGKICDTCQKGIHTGIDLGLAHSGYESCCMKDCGAVFCTNCVESYVKLGKNMEVPEGYRSVSKDGKALGTCVCHKKCVPILMEFDRRINVDKQQKYIEKYLATDDESPIPKQFYYFPSSDVNKDNTERKAFRFLSALGDVAEIVGMKYIKRALEASYLLWHGSSFLQYLISEELLRFMSPLMQHFKYLGIYKPHDFLTLYYLACKHELDVKSDPLFEMKAHSKGQLGVIDDACPLELLDWIGEFLGPASYLYTSRMSKPHQANEWSEWYLSKLVRRDGWTVISCYNSPIKLADGTYRPGFAVLCRDERSVIHRPASINPNPLQCTRKEVLICIKGSTDILDWGINLNETPEEINYYSGPYGQTCVEGKVHRGIAQGARAILENYGVRECIKSLVERGYTVRVVGHSLGAATAAVMTVELLNGFRELYGGKKLLPDIRGIGFGVPAMLTSEISNALQEGHPYPTFTSVINREDIVPRIRLQTLLRLCEEMRDFEDTAKIMYEKDMQSYKKWLISIGEKPMASTKQDDFFPTSSSETKDKVSSPRPSETTTEESAKSETATETLVKSVVPPELLQVHLCVPGKIVYFYKCHGLDRASLVTHEHPFLHRIKLSIDRNIADHKYEEHHSAIISVRRQYNLMLGAMGRNADGTNTSSTIFRVACPFQNIVDEEILKSKPFSGAQEADALKLGSLAGPFRSCNVCELATNWAYIAHSSATTARVTHCCRACGDVVCAICAPAGDIVQGEGVNRQETLGDKRISIPAIGIFERERVCIPCYNQSYFF